MACDVNENWKAEDRLKLYLIGNAVTWILRLSGFVLKSAVAIRTLP